MTEKILSHEFYVWMLIGATKSGRSYYYDPRHIDLDRGLDVKLRRVETYVSGRLTTVDFFHDRESLPNVLVAREEITYTVSDKLLQSETHTITYTEKCIEEMGQSDDYATNNYTDDDFLVTNPESQKVWVNTIDGAYKGMRNTQRRMVLLNDVRAYLFGLKASQGVTSANLKSFFLATKADQDWFVYEVNTNDLKAKLEDTGFQIQHAWMTQANWATIIAIINI